nr:response regulator transcription factor [Clostridia bacterium]
MRILIISGDTKLTDALSYDLRHSNLSPDFITDTDTGFDYILSDIYDAVVIDMNARPQRDNIVAEMHNEHIVTPTMCICTTDDVSERIRLLDSGADDCICRSFIYEELVARIKALARRQVMVQLENVEFADLSLWTSDMTLHCGYRSVKLSYKEFEVMRILMLNSHSIIRKETLLVKIWGSDSEAVYNNVEAYISLLRKKLFQVGSGVYISAIRGVGYQLEFRNPT